MAASSGYQEADWYDCPRYYDIIFDQDTRREADFLEAVLELHGACANRKRATRVLEPACGTGRLVVELARRGYHVTGFDANPRMLAVAREKLTRRPGLGARVKEDRMEDFRVPGRFDLVHCLLSSFKYLLTEDASASHLRRAADRLRPGGLFVLGIHLTDYSRQKPHHERWTGNRRGVEVTCNTRTWPADRKRRLEDLRNRLEIRRSNGASQRLETLWKCRTYDAAELKKLFRKIPDLDRIAQYSFNYDLDDPLPLDGSREDVVVVLRKKEG